MSRRTLMIACLSAAFAFAGGYALLDSMQPAAAPARASSRPADPTKVVAVPGSALVPLNDGSTEWLLVGPGGTVLAGPDGRPPAATTSATYLDELVGTYLEGFPEAYAPSQDAAREGSKDERRDHEDHDDDDDHDSKDRKDQKDRKDRKDHEDHDDDDHDDHHDAYALSTTSSKPAKANARSRK